MKALILAAGLGTRLLPYTKVIPKPLFTLMSSPMLEHLIQILVDTGCKQIVINTHHLHEQIKDFVMQNRYRDIIHTIVSACKHGNNRQLDCCSSSTQCDFPLHTNIILK